VPLDTFFVWREDPGSVVNRLAIVVLCAVGALGLGHESGLAATGCGKVDPTTKKKLRAALTLNAESRTTLTFKRSTDSDDLSFDFKVAGCDLAQRLKPMPEVFILPVADPPKAVPNRAIKLQTARTTDGSDLVMTVSVNPTSFEPGTYGGLAVISAPYLATSRIPITVSRSDEDTIEPAGIALVGALAGFLLFVLFRRLTRDQLQVSWIWVLAVGVVSVLVGLLTSFFTTYWDQDVWTLDDNLRATAVAAFTGATTGTMAGVLSAVWKAPAKQTTAAPATPPTTPTPPSNS